MQNKVAIAVFRPEDPVESKLQDAFYDASGRWMTMGEMKALVKALSQFKGMGRAVEKHMDAVADVLNRPNDSSHWYYPCDVAELRHILGDQEIRSTHPVTLVSPKVARHLLPDYGCFLVLDKEGVEGRELMGVCLTDDPFLSTKNSLRMIMVRDWVRGEGLRALHHIIKETHSGVTAFVMTDLAGMEPRKVAMAEAHWEVTVPKFGVKGEKTYAPTAEQAMQNVLDRVRKVKSPQSDPVHPPDEYMWQNYQEFIPMLVKRIDRVRTSSWYSLAKESAVPSEFPVGQLPKGIEDPDIEYQRYEAPHEALVIQVGDRVGWRFSNIKMPLGLTAKNVPVSRSLLEKPVAGDVVEKNADHLMIRWEGEKDPKPFPIRHVEFLVRFKDVV